MKTVILDDFVKNENINKIDYMWLDMQGYESIVLKNSPNVLKMANFIHTETHNTENYEGNMLTPEYVDFLEKNGFALLFDGASSFTDGGDLTFVKKSYYDTLTNQTTK